MALSRSSTAVALLRALSRSPTAQHSKLCFECLVNPASCQISSIVAASARPGYGYASLRLQSTSSTTSASVEVNSSLPPLSQRCKEGETNTGQADEAAIATTISEASSSSPAVSNEKPRDDLPTLEDLDALKTRDLLVPDVTEPASSPQVGMYARRFKGLSARVARAFNREQLTRLAKLSGVDGVNWPTRKADMVKQILTQYWGLTDPAEYTAREAQMEKLDAQKSRDVTEDVPVTEKEVFFLLGKGRSVDLLQRLAYKTRVKASVRGASPSILRLKGPPRQVEAVTQEWARLKRDISTQLVDTNLAKPLRPDLYKSLSRAVDAYIIPKDRRGKRIELSHRSGNNTVMRRVEAALHFLRLQSSILSNNPRFAFLDSGAADNAYLPIVPENPPPWDLQALGPLAMTRFTSMTQPCAERYLHESGVGMSEDGVSALQSVLLGPLEDMQGTLSYNARFGHLLRLNTQASFQKISSTTLSEWDAQPDDVFLPATPAGIANRYTLGHRRYESRHLQQHTADLKLSVKRLRKLLYVPEEVSMPLPYLQFERILPRRSESTVATMEADIEQPNPWKGEHGRRSFVHVSVPHNLTDLRLEASKSTSLPPEASEALKPVVLNAPPASIAWNDRMYHLVQDVRIRETVFLSGIPESLNVHPELLEPVLERRTDSLFPPHERSTAFELRSKTSGNLSEALSGILWVLGTAAVVN